MNIKVVRAIIQYLVISNLILEAVLKRNLIIGANNKLVNIKMGA